MKQILWIVIIFALSSFFTVYAANPASKEYVDQQDNKLQTEINTINSDISAIESGFRVGQFYQGGVIFWLDPTKNNKGGLIADIADLAGTYQWSTANTTTSATLNGAYQGRNSATACNSSACNTFKILSTPGATYPAASACAADTQGGFNDWYLPSLQELESLFANQMTITRTALAHGGSAFADINNSPIGYWTSNELNTAVAWLFGFGNGTQNTNAKSGSFRVRCIRAFNAN